MSYCQHNLNKMTAMTTKRKRVSKKNKKSWRKNVDVTDVDNFLEDQRLQERLGVKYAEEKDENLFHIDTTGDENESTYHDKSNKYVENKTKNVILYETSGFSMRLRETEVPKCFEPLVKRSAVPVAIDISSRVKRNARKESNLQRKLAAKNERALKRSSECTKSEKKKALTHSFTYDVWAKKEEKIFDSDWLTSETKRHNIQNMGKHKKKIPETVIKKTSLLPAIELPHPGLSYNPSLKDHQDILKKAAEQELEVIKEEKHLKRVTKDMFSMVSKEEQEKEWLAEMTVGLTQTKEGSDEDDGEDYKALNPPVRNKKKTLQKRRKLREAIELKEKLKNQKINKKKLSDIYKLKKFNESLDKREKRILKNIEKRKEKKSQKGFKTKVLSQIKYQEPDIDFHMAEDLSGNLRNVKPEGNLLLERYKSLQKRNILAPTIKRKGTKAKLKQYERNNTKMDWEIMKDKKPFKKF